MRCGWGSSTGSTARLWWDDERAVLAECWRLVDRGVLRWIGRPPEREPERESEYVQGDLLSDADEEPLPW